MLPTVGFPVAQFNPVQQPLMAVGIVPIAGVDVLKIPARCQPLTRPKKMGAITTIDHLKYDLEPERGIPF